VTEPPEERDTIAAIATPPGAGGVGIVRVSGPRALAALARVVARPADSFVDRHFVASVARDPDTGERLDDVLCVVMRGPRSFTGEDVAEIHGHGGPINMARLLRAVLASGAGVRPAEPGEFTRRAFENGRIDLTRAEAVLAVIEAASERALRLAQSQLAGDLGQRIAELRRAGTALLADVEASIDFPEEGLELTERRELGGRAAGLAEECECLVATFEAGRALRDGVHVALCGPVNAGKSSLFNRLVGSERALVAAEPGTTRDFVEARVVWKGVSITLVDTAGLREAASDVERRGIELGAARARAADIEVHLVAADELDRKDGSIGESSIGDASGHESSIGNASAGNDRRILRVVSKGDRLVGMAAPHLVTSALTGQGLAELMDAVLDRATSGGLADEGGALLTSERQRARAAAAATAFARASRADAQPEEVTALELREAVEALAEILGERVGDEVLDALFARFCIGK
jgi:tRNA modification GTPase